VSDLPTVTVVIPALDEEHDLRGCLEAVARQTYPAELVEVVVVDGCSQDATVAVAVQVGAELDLDLRVVSNERRRTSTSLNVGLAEATGDVIVRLDARSRVQADYIERCVVVLGRQPEVGVVGGRQVPFARSGGLTDRGIARALSNRYTTGFARYRRATGPGPTDTVWMGVFRADELRELGGWDDEVALNEDWELNRRYRDAGRVVWFDPGLVSGYLPRADLASLARQHFYFGRVKGLWWARGTRPEARQLAMVAGPPVAGIVLLALGRRRPALALFAVPAVLLVADEVGSDRPASAAERGVSAAAIGLYGSAWWVGTVVGAVGERLGVEHRHRSAPR
jgi:glycosyltransferase involved in cell wall biosynthesis